MKRRFIIPLLLLLTLVTTKSFSQTTTSVLKDSVDHINDKAWDLKSEDSESAVMLANQARDLAEQIKYYEGLGTSYKILGLARKYQGLYEESEESFRKSIDIFEANNLPIEKAKVYHNLAGLKEEEGYFTKAIDYELNAIAIFDRLEEEFLSAKAKINLANIYDSNQEYDKAIEINLQSLETLRRLDEKQEIADCMYGLANRYFNQERYDLALNYYDQSLQLFIELDDEYGQALSYNSKGVIYTNKDSFQQASSLLLKSKDLFQKLNYHLGIFDAQMALGILRKKQGAFQDALALFKEAEQNLGDRGGLREQHRLHYQLSGVYDSLGNTDMALVHLKKFQALNESLFNEEKAKVIAAIENQYKNEKLQRKNAEVALQAEKAGNQRNIALLASGLLLFLLVSGTYLHRKQQRQNRVINEQQRQIHQQEIKDLMKDHELQFVNAKLEGQEQERNRLSKELHDRLGSDLVYLIWQYGAVLETIENQKLNKEQFQQANEKLNEVYQDIRDISQRLKSDTLEEAGLIPALRNLCSSISLDGKIKANTLSHGLNGRLPQNMELHIYRIIQELISNTLKHAKATKIDVQVNRLDDELSIIVEDNGRGFNPEKNETEGIGLKNIRSRVKEMNGKMEIDASERAGTTVMIEIPV